MPGADSATPYGEAATADSSAVVPAFPDPETIRLLRRVIHTLPNEARRYVDGMEERVRVLELQLADRTVAAGGAQSEQVRRLADTLRNAADQIRAMKEEIDRLAQPPQGIAVFQNQVGDPADGTAVVVTRSGEMLVNSSPNVDLTTLTTGTRVYLNETLSIVGVADPPREGEVRGVVEVLDGGDRVRVTGNADESLIVTLAAELRGGAIEAGDSVLVQGRFAYEKLQKNEVQDLLLEEVPDISYEDVGGLDAQVQQVRDALELPVLHGDLFEQMHLGPRKGVLLYGPPGCGKTLIAKAVANSLAQRAAEINGGDKRPAYFINIKGPELLNKYVGETERQIREVFAQARKTASDGSFVVIFFDEMESLFRLRGAGISSDVESTIVPQLLTELDGVEGLKNVVVIGASNREDLIDSAVLRPGRLDVKIKVDRPDADAARSIFSKHLDASVPMEGKGQSRESAQGAVDRLIDTAVQAMFARDENTRFLEITYTNAEKEVLHFGDFASGAMIAGIVDRAKLLAIKRHLDGSGAPLAIRSGDMKEAVAQEFRENEDLPNTSNPDDWAKIAGRRGMPIHGVRSLVHEPPAVPARPIETTPGTGPYL